MKLKKSKLKTIAYSEPPKDKLLEKILRQCGAYYHSGDFFYHELWRERLRQIGFRVISVERGPHHPVWHIKLFGTLAAQAYLLVAKPMSKRNARARDPLLAQLKSEVQQLAKDMGQPIKSDCVSVGRTGPYFRVGFLWPLGKDGLLLNKEKQTEAFSFLIRPWLRKNRN